jgi:hypothetical protein
MIMAIRVGDMKKVYQEVKFDAIEQNGGRSSAALLIISAHML